MGTTVQLDLWGKIVHPHTCKYCGKGFTKKHNRQMYCNAICAHYARLESKARYQQKRRRQLKEGHIISNENRYVGTSFLSKRRRKNFKDEYDKIQKEMRRLKLR